MYRTYLVWILKNWLYGLRKSLRLWHSKINEYQIEKIHYKISYNNHFIYTYHKTCVIMIISIYVEELLIAVNNVNSIKWMKGKLRNIF